MFKWYETPKKSLTADGWHDWKTETKAKYPVQYFLREDVPFWFRCNVTGRIERAYWWVMHRFHPKHRYHVIKPRSLKPGYHDPETRIFYTIFDELSRYAEDVLMGDGVNGTRWSQEEIDGTREEYGEKEHLKLQVAAESRIVALRNWWVNVYPNRENDFPDLENYMEEGRPFLWPLMDRYKDTEDYKKFQEWSKKNRAVEEAHHEEDKEKLKEAIDLINHLWYP